MSVKIPKIVTGTDAAIQATWKVGDTATPVAIDAAVKAVLVSSDYATALTTVVVQSSTATAADWPAGTIIVEIPGTETDLIEDLGFAAIQLQVTPNGGSSRSGYFPVEIIKGHIPPA